MDTTERGDSIEIGLLVGLISPSPNSSQPSEGEVHAPPVDPSGAVRVTIRISHRFASPEGADISLVSPDEVRPKPYFSTLLFRRILRQIGGTLKCDLPPPELFSEGRTCELDVVLDLTAPAPITHCTKSQNQPVEPTLEQLSSFGESLKGKRAILYASVKGSFAHHLTTCLTAWGMDVTHVSPGGEVDGSTEHSGTSIVQHPASVFIDAAQNLTRLEPRSSSPELVFIDDDVDILKDRLHTLRSGSSPNVGPRKKPSLSTNHRPRSSQHVSRVLNNLRAPAAVVILHFTSLSNYKLVKDIVQSIMALFAAMAIPLPEVMIIPKPAGPRRFLTALHTAITKPMVDPFFMPIATSPGGVPMQIASTPTTPSTSENASNQASATGSQGSSAAITPSQTQPPLGKTSTRPIGSRTNSDRSIKSLEGPGGLANPVLPPSPLALPDNVEYFSSNAQKLGNSPSSGVVIQSPDGQTTGIYFHPKKNASRNPSSNNIEKEMIQSGPTPSRRQSTSRVVKHPNKEDTMTFSTLYESPQKTTHSPTKTTPSPLPEPLPEVQEPSPSTTCGPPTAVPSPSKIITAPLDSQLKPSISPSSSRRASEVSRATEGSPAVRFSEESDASPTKRASSRKPPGADTNDTKDPSSPLSAKQKGKMATTGDANVVPPISVLIVDGMRPLPRLLLLTHIFSR